MSSLEPGVSVYNGGRGLQEDFCFSFQFNQDLKDFQKTAL